MKVPPSSILFGPSSRSTCPKSPQAVPLEMPYLSNTDADRQEMLRSIGVKSVDELFAMIPPEDRFAGPLAIPAGLTELELGRLLHEREQTLQPATEALNFLGCGAYDHFIPSVVDALASDPRYVTAYTPYQAEASQGSLQTFFEYQTLIARLTGMDLSNASHYDGATACVEAVLMSHATTKRRKIIVPESLHPEYRQVLATYIANLPVEIVTLPTPGGAIELDALRKMLDADTACVLVQHPNFFGNLESVQKIGEAVHAAGGLFVMCVDPISLGVLKRPSELGADIVVAEGQPLGMPLSDGGPYLGIMACRESLLRRIPGRLVGQTTDRHGNACWVLTMQTREQHIRREKATSNICSNQGLMAVRACIYLAALGPKGLREVAELCARKSRYLADRITSETVLKLAFPSVPFFKEFTVRLPQGKSARSLVESLAAQRTYPGVALSRFGMDDTLLTIAVTEKKTQADLDRFVESLALIL